MVEHDGIVDYMSSEFSVSLTPRRSRASCGLTASTCSLGASAKSASRSGRARPGSGACVVNSTLRKSSTGISCGPPRGYPDGIRDGQISTNNRACMIGTAANASVCARRPARRDAPTARQRSRFARSQSAAASLRRVGTARRRSSCTRSRAARAARVRCSPGWSGHARRHTCRPLRPPARGSARAVVID